MTKHFSLSLWHLPSEWHQLNGAEQPNSDAEAKGERDGEKNTSEKAWREKENGKGVNDSKEEKSDRTGRAVPARHCFTSHCTEEENLSYASASHIAFTIYVQTRIMELDGSVEKTPINLIMFSIFFSLPFFLFQRPSNPLSLCSLVFICSSLFPDFLCKGIQQQAFVSCILYSAKLVELVSTKSAHTHSLCPSHAPCKPPASTQRPWSISF